MTESPPIIEGFWQPIRAELDGQIAPAMALERMEMRLEGGRYQMRFGDTAAESGTYLVAVESDLIVLTLAATQGENAGRTIPAIAQLRGDRLRICFGLDGVRPAEFLTALGAGRYLVTYKRTAGETR